MTDVRDGHRRAFDPARLTQARRLAGKTKKALSADVKVVSAVAIGQYESGAVKPRDDLLPVLADALDVPTGFLLAGRPHAPLDAAAAHFRSLRSTPAIERNRAIAFVEQVSELTLALSRRVKLPTVDLPGFSAGEVDVSERDMPAEPVAAAAVLRERWGLRAGPVQHLVRQLESRGIVVVFTPVSDHDVARVDAFSTSATPRPIIVSTPDRADDVYRHRYSVAHELAHLVLHADAEPGDPLREKEADTFAAAFLTPGDELEPVLPRRVDFAGYARLSAHWGVEVKSLIYRSRELGVISDVSARRAYQRLNIMKDSGSFPADPVGNYSGEMPAMLKRAFALASEHGLKITTLAEELQWPVTRLRQLLDWTDERPVLRLV
jgi:Zn-dependent peptidase ImmA (M78 family)/transcriptional regulator with XRE-family HTH domain